MQRYVVSQFDGSTFQVVDEREQREICVCSDYDEWEDSEQRAQRIADLLNQEESRRLHQVRVLRSSIHGKLYFSDN
jgi:hypothetical protein